LKYFLSFRIFEKHELALKTEFALNFSSRGGDSPPPRTPLALNLCKVIVSRMGEVKGLTSRMGEVKGFWMTQSRPENNFKWQFPAFFLQNKIGEKPHF